MKSAHLHTMFTYQKVMIGLAILSFVLPIALATFGVFVRPLDGDPVGGVGPG